MTKFNTGNPVGSSDPRDLYDNAENLDNLVNGDQAAYNDRLGKSRRSWQSVEDQVNQQADQYADDKQYRDSTFASDQSYRANAFRAEQNDREGVFNSYLVSAGYQFAGDYAAGIEITQYNQVVKDTSGEFWRVSGSTELPYTTTGAGLPEGGNFVAVGDAALRNELAGIDSQVLLAGDTAQSLRRVTPYQYTQMGIAFRSDDPSAPIQMSAGMWPHGSVSYDVDDDKFVILYNINSGHAIRNNRVMMRKKDPEGGFGQATVVADRIAQGESMKCQSSGIAANGDYIALIAVLATSGSSILRTDIYRSTDKGSTWTSSELLADGSSVTARNGDVTGFLVLSSGRIISWYNDSVTDDCNIIYSDDNGVSWSKASIAGSPKYVTEPAWCELSDGTIVCMARATIFSSDLDTRVPAKFLKSDDGGLTWSEPVDSTSITDFTLSNGEMIYHEDTKTVEFIHHSRRIEDDNYSSLYVSTATEYDAKNDNFSQQVRIGKLAAALGSVSPDQGDSGYVAAKKSAHGIINVFYYTGPRSSSQINWAIGRKAKGNEYEPDIDPNTGELANEVIRGKYETIVYNGGDSFDLATPFIHGPRSGSYTILKGAESYQLALTDLARVSCMPINGIDLTDVNTLFVSAESLVMEGSNDFALYLYDVPNPAPISGPNRIRFEAKAFIGFGTIEMDVRDLTGVYYPALILSNVFSAGLPAEVNVMEFGFTSDVFEVRPPQEENPTKTLYRYGSQRAHITGGWSELITSTDGTVTIDSDFIKLDVDGTVGRRYAAVAANDMLDLTDISTIEILVDVESTGNNSEVEVCVFNKRDPVGEIDGRIAYRGVKDTGLQKVYLDVRDLDVSGYVTVKVQSNVPAGTSPGIINAKVISVALY